MTFPIRNPIMITLLSADIIFKEDAGLMNNVETFTHNIDLPLPSQHQVKYPVQTQAYIAKPKSQNKLCTLQSLPSI